jgi:hypothetical protein
MPDTTPPVSTCLNRVERNGDTRQPELAPVARDRLAEVDFGHLLRNIQNALDEFVRAVDGEQNTIEFIGIVVVGSFLTEEFASYQSDLDLYLLTDEAFKDEDAFCQMLLDPGSTYRHQLYSAIPQNTTYVDPLGVWVKGAHWNVIREPSLTLERGDKQ